MDIEEIIYDLSYNDIMKMPEEIRFPFLLRFNEILNDISKDIYSDRKSLMRMLYETEEQKELMISDYTFSGERVNYYPNIIFRKTARDYTCSVSGARHSRGSECLIFKPFFYLPRSRECYVLAKPIKANYYYDYFFPKTIKEYDYFSNRVERSYELGDDEYYNFFCNIGGNLTLRRLNRKK